MDKKKLKRPTPQMPKNKNNSKTVVFFIILVIFGALMFSSYRAGDGLKSVEFSDLIRRANAGEITKIEVIGDQELRITKKGIMDL